MSKSNEWFQTNSGVKFNPANPKLEDICIDDIANSLQFQCRFNGHCNVFYSVAEHSFIVSQIVPEEFALEGLLHDASEAYLQDIPKPLKNLLPDYQKLEYDLEVMLANKYNLIFPYPKEVKIADNQILSDEAFAMMTVPPLDWNIDPPVGIKFFNWEPRIAKKMFLDRYNELMVKKYGKHFEQRFMELHNGTIRNNIK